MNSRLRKSVSNRGKQKKLQNVKNLIILHHILGCLQSSSLAKHTLKSGLARVCIMHLLWQQAQAITMQNLEDQEALTGTLRVGIKGEATIRTAEDRAEAMEVARILSKGEDLHRTLVVGWVEQLVHGVLVAVATELVDRTTNKVARMVHPVQVEDQTTIKVAPAISSSMGTGNNMAVSSCH
jgi:hypothetical protein